MSIEYYADSQTKNTNYNQKNKTSVKCCTNIIELYLFSKFQFLVIQVLDCIMFVKFSSE